MCGKEMRSEGWFGNNPVTVAFPGIRSLSAGMAKLWTDKLIVWVWKRLTPCTLAIRTCAGPRYARNPSTLTSPGLWLYCRAVDVVGGRVSSR